MWTHSSSLQKGMEKIYSVDVQSIHVVTQQQSPQIEDRGTRFTLQICRASMQSLSSSLPRQRGEEADLQCRCVITLSLHTSIKLPVITRVSINLSLYIVCQELWQFVLQNYFWCVFFVTSILLDVKKPFLLIILEEKPRE